MAGHTASNDGDVIGNHGVYEDGDGKVAFGFNDNNKLIMTSSGTSYTPVAVKAHRVFYSKGVFEKLELITDHRELF